MAKTWDPEGILSTLPAIVTGVFGLIAGHIILHQLEIKQKLLSLFYMGFVLIALGDLWQWFSRSIKISGAVHTLV